MADSKLADLTAITTPATTDILYLVHDPAGTPVDRKITVANLLGASSRWASRLNDTADSLTNWTTVAGTWSSAGGVISKTSSPASWEAIRTTAAIRAVGYIMEARIRFPSAGQPGSGTWFAGFYVGSGTADSGTQMMVRLARPFGSSAGTVDVVANSTVISNPSVTLASDTFYKLRVIQHVGGAVVVLLDGVELTAYTYAPPTNVLNYMALVAYNCKADFDDIKVWTDTGDLPA